MKKLKETEIGNIQSATFRPTEAESLILLNIVDMTEQGRNVTQQDAINVPEEKLKEKEIGADNLESAFAQLIKLKMIEINPDQTLQISAAGQPVVDELKKAEQQAELTAGDEANPQAGEQPQNPMGDQSAMPDQTPGMPPMESFEMIRYLNDMSKLLT